MSDRPAAVLPDMLDHREEALAFLLSASDVLASSLDLRETLTTIAQLTVPGLADFAVIDLLQPDGSLRRERSVHVDPEKHSALRRAPAIAQPSASTARVLGAAEPILLPRVGDDADEAALPPGYLHLAQTAGARSLIFVPLSTRDRVIGAMLVGRSEHEGPYEQGHFDLVAQLAARAAIALDHALRCAAAERARDEAELSSAALQRLVRASDYVMVEFDAEGRFLSVAETSAPAVYLPREQLIGRTIREVFPPATADRFASWISTALREGRSIDVEYPLRIGPRTVWFAGSVSPIGDDRGVWLVRDVTARKVAEEALAESERRFRSTFDQAAVGISHIELGGRFLRVNRRLAEIVGYSRDELLRLTFRDITYPADREAHEAQTERLLAGEIDSYTIEKRYVHKSGEVVWVSVTGSLVRKENGRPDYLISVIQDISERKSLEEQLIRAQKMEAVGRMAGGVAHEFNNALTTITGFADLVLRTLPAQDPLRPDIEEISRAAWRAAGVAGRLMAFSSKEASQPEIVDLGSVVADTQRMLAQLIGEDVELELDLHSEPTYVRGDRRELEQVMVNLAVNARDAMPQGGKLSLSTTPVHLDAEATRRLGELPPNEYVCLTVEDTGEGMTLEVREKIFDPFFTTKSGRKGTGLGLSIVYGIVKRSGGGIDVESTPGKGTTFRIYLPRIRRPGKTVVVAGEAPTAAAHGGRVLLVEDDNGVRTLAERVMRRLGYEVYVASTPTEALRVIESDGQRFDLLVTDLVMPGMSGRELARRLSAVHPDLRVLFTSGYSSDQVLRREVEKEQRAFLAKPFAPEELERALRSALER